MLESCIRQIKSHNSELNTFITVLFEQALKEAENAERRIKKGVWLGPLDGIPFSVKDMIQIKGVRCTAVDYIHAYKLKNQLTNNFLEALKATDVLVLPSTSITAPKFKSFMNDDENLSIRNSLLRNSIPSNISGLPAVNVPVGLDRFGIPVGVQIVGRPFEEAIILSLGYKFEHQIYTSCLRRS